MEGAWSPSTEGVQELLAVVLLPDRLLSNVISFSFFFFFGGVLLAMGPGPVHTLKHSSTELLTNL